MDRLDIYEYRNYKSFLQAFVGPRRTRSGKKSGIARALRCQPTYISQVLYGSAHLSLEHAELLSDFLGLTQDEKHYFLLLIQKDRAGTKRLESFFAAETEKILSKRLVLTERLGAENKLSKEDQSVYYSSWHYAAIHIGLTVPGLRSAGALAQHFRIPLKRVLDVLEFLSRAGLAQKTGGEFVTGTTLIRLGNSSQNIIKHHTNWRIQAIESLEREELNDLHYSAAVTLSAADIVKIKNRTLEFLKETIKEIQTSPEEELCCFCIDFFNMKR